MGVTRMENIPKPILPSLENLKKTKEVDVTELLSEYLKTTASTVLPTDPLTLGGAVVATGLYLIEPKTAIAARFVDDLADRVLDALKADPKIKAFLKAAVMYPVGRVVIKKVAERVAPKEADLIDKIATAVALTPATWFATYEMFTGKQLPAVQKQAQQNKS